MASYGRLEEALRKHDPKNLESGIEQASLMIDTDVDDARLYLLRAKLLYKLLVSWCTEDNTRSMCTVLYCILAH